MLVPLSNAETFTGVATDIEFACTGNVAEENPAGIITDAGIDATPPVPLTMVKVAVVSTAVGPVSVRCPTVDPPLVTDVGVNENALSTGASTVSPVEAL